jgi:hypothetical protein
MNICAQTNRALLGVAHDDSGETRHYYKSLDKKISEATRLRVTTTATTLTVYGRSIH